MPDADRTGRGQGADEAAGRLENRTLWERVYGHLREEILANRLPADTELSEVALSQQLGVSRGPIRESLGRLAAEGLVTVRPRRGAVVRSLSRDEFLDAYQVREALEMLAVRLAVPRLDEAGFAALDGLIDEMQACAAGEDVSGFFAANERFHASLVVASGNGKLEEMHAQLLGQMGRYRMQSLQLRGTLERSVSEHRAILRAARKGDVERAVHLMSEHIRIPQRRIQALEHGAPNGSHHAGGEEREP